MKNSESIIKSLCDTDFYKLSMMQVAFHQHPTSLVEYEFKCRNKDVDLTPYASEIRHQIDLLQELSFTQDELNFLTQYKNGEVFKPDFIKYLSTFKLNPEKNVKIYRNEDNKLSIKISGLWVETILFEIYILSIVNEVYFRNTQPDADFMFGLNKLYNKIESMKKSTIPFKFMEFGTRRRYSQKWQETVVRVLRDNASHYLLGTSNIDLGRRLNIPVLGSQAHEMYAFNQSISYLKCHELTLNSWVKEYNNNLLIALSDIYSTDAFLHDMSLNHAQLFDGLRQDSGDPYVWADKVINFYKAKNIDPLTKIALFSDGLTIDKALKINQYCFNKIKPVFGIGTSLTNDFGFPALNIVIKMVKANSKDVIKISDEPTKAIGNKQVIEQVKSMYKGLIND